MFLSVLYSTHLSFHHLQAPCHCQKTHHLCPVAQDHPCTWTWHSSREKETYLLLLLGEALGEASGEAWGEIKHPIQRVIVYTQSNKRTKSRDNKIIWNTSPATTSLFKQRYLISLIQGMWEWCWGGGTMCSDQILHLYHSHTFWSWLSPIQTEGVPLFHLPCPALPL